MRGLKDRLPVTQIVILIALIAISGLFYMIGYENGKNATREEYFFGTAFRGIEFPE